MTLLFDASPIAVYPDLAASLGSLQEALVLQQLHNQLCDSTNFKNGAVWVCRSIASWQSDVFPWIKSETTLRSYFNANFPGFYNSMSKKPTITAFFEV